MRLIVNGKEHQVAANWGEEKLLFTLREHLGLMGTKYGCGIGLCGSCKVQVDGKVMTSCLLRTADVEGREVRTIEGLAYGGKLHPLQQAWMAESVPQCGYCQAGMLIQAEGLLAEKPDPSDEDILAAMAGNLCRCGTYDRIKKAIRRAAEIAGNERQNGG